MAKAEIAILGTGDTPDGEPAVPQPIADAAGLFSPAIVEVPGAVFPINPDARATCEQAYIDAAAKAHQAGYRGAYINTVGDYGLAEIQGAGQIATSGAGEGAIRTALGQYRRFAIVTIWPPQMRFIYDAVLNHCQAEDRCVAIHHLSADIELTTLDQPDNFVDRMRGCSLTSMQHIRDACGRGLHHDGADVIILGCTCMAPTAPLLQQEGIPVIEPMAAGYRYLEQLLTDEDAASAAGDHQ